MKKQDNGEETTVTHKSIASALAAAQSEMGRAKKSATNPHFKKMYADLDSVCDAAMPALNRHGIAVVQPLEKDGNDWLVLTRFVHGDSGESMDTPMPLIMGKRDMQGLGSAITYARRYGLMTLAGIAPEDDDGNAAVKGIEQERRQEPRPEPKQPEPKFQNGRPPGVPDDIYIAVESLGNADTLDALKAIWVDLPPAVKSAPLVIEAKDTRKVWLEAQAKPANADLGGDDIPY